MYLGQRLVRPSQQAAESRCARHELAGETADAVKRRPPNSHVIDGPTIIKFSPRLSTYWTEVVTTF